MASCEYHLGYRAALRHLIEATEYPAGCQLKKMSKLFFKKESR